MEGLQTCTEMKEPGGSWVAMTSDALGLCVQAVWCDVLCSQSFPRWQHLLDWARLVILIGGHWNSHLLLFLICFRLARVKRGWNQDMVAALCKQHCAAKQENSCLENRSRRVITSPVVFLWLALCAHHQTAGVFITRFIRISQTLCFSDSVPCRPTPASLWPWSCLPCWCVMTGFPCSPGVVR